MGGVMSCVNDVQFTNPAFAAVQEDCDLGLRINTTDLDNGPRLTSFEAHYVHPLVPNQTGLQLTVLTLDSSSGSTTLPGMGPAAAALSEDALVVDYGRRLGEQLAGGLSVLGYQHSKFSLASPLGPKYLDLSAEADYGFRGGVAYEYQPGDWLGVAYSYSQNTIKANGLMLGGASRTVFHSDFFAIGASRHLRPDTLAAVEFQRGTTGSGPSSSSTNSWHLGAEHILPQGWALRAGLSDGSPSFGLGYANARWRLDYACVSDWNDDAVGTLFGRSDTHSLHLSYRW